MIVTRLVLAGVLTLCVAAEHPRAAQAPPQRPQPPVFRTNTELVEIDVLVHDKNGQPVHGLTRDDFVLRDRRKVQPIETFVEVRREATRERTAPALPAGIRTDVASNTHAQQGRLVVLVLDDLHVWQGRTNTVKDIARKIVADLDPGSSMALLQTGRNHSTEVTNDRTRLLDAIDRFQGRRSFRRPLIACDPQPLPPKDPATTVAWETPSGCNTEEVSANFGLYNTMDDAAKILGRGDQRRKAFILVSENIAKDLSGLFHGGTQTPDAPLDSSGYATSGDPLDLSRLGPVPRLDWALINMMKSFRAGNVATYAIDPRGEVTSQELELECHPSPPTPQQGGPDPCVDPFRWRSWVRLGQEGLSHIAEETGGFAVVNTDDFAGGISRILADFDNYYLLGFHTPDLTSQGFRPVDVTVRGRPDLMLRFRRGYQLQVDDEDARKEKPGREPLASLVETPLPSSDFPMRLHALPVPTSGNRARVAIALELTLPTKTMAGSETERLLDDIRYGVFAVDLKGQKVRESSGSGARIALRPRAGLLAMPDTVTYQLALEMELPPGRYQLRAAAISDKLGAGGSVYLPLDVPDFSKSEVLMTDLLLAYADGAHVPVARDFQRVITRGGAPAVERPRPLPFDPTLDRIFRPSDVLRLFFRTTGRADASMTATISALDASGTTVVTFDRPVEQESSVDIRLPLAQLPPGGYTLQVVVSDGKRTATKAIGFAVR